MEVQYTQCSLGGRRGVWAPRGSRCLAQGFGWLGACRARGSGSVRGGELGGCCWWGRRGMGSARTRVLIVCGAGTRAQRKAPDPGTQLPTPRERPRRGGTAPCPRSHNGDGNRGWEVKSPGSRWEACRDPSRSHLAGGSSIQFLLACQPLVHRRGEINRSPRQRFGELGAPRKCFTITGVALNSLVSCPRYVAFCWGVRGLKGWVFMCRGYTLSRFFTL